MERINYNSLRIFEYLDNLNPRNSGILFSILFHLIILLFAVGLPNFFGPKEVFVPNIIPIEILNVSETTNIEVSDNDKNINNKSSTKQKKFNSSENTEIQKNYEITENIKTIDDNDQPKIEIQQKTNIQIQEKKNIDVKEKKMLQTEKKIETIKTNNIKPKLKPRTKKQDISKTTSDMQIEPRTIKETKPENNKTINKPKVKPKEDFSIASMLKDLRNEKTNNMEEESIVKEDKNQSGKKEQNNSMILSISEIDLLRQQLSSCWNAPAGAVINVGDKVTISAKVNQNMTVFDNSIRIVDTNISKTNPFYGPITDSAMRTLLNPECTPLKLPKDKYNLWKNLTITFDYSIMKGY